VPRYSADDTKRLDWIVLLNWKGHRKPNEMSAVKSSL
jgi:hypothetical protein